MSQPISIRSQIESLHAAYCAAARIRPEHLPLDMSREAAWFEWIRRGLTVQDLVALVKHHVNEAQHHRPARSITFRSIVGNVDYAQEDLSLIRSRRRAAPADPARNNVLRATGRQPAEPPRPPRDLDAIRAAIARLHAAADNPPA